MTFEMDKDYLLKKWLNGELTDAEMKTFSEQEDFQLNKKIIDSAKYFKASNQIQVDDFESFKKAFNNQKKSPIKKLYPLLRIAAMLVVAALVYFSFFFNTNTIIQTQVAEKTNLVLPDQSQVVLNALSSITYNEKDWSEKRDVELNGEAYFKVAKGKTFNVITATGTVTVVGTQFNVKHRDRFFEVQCFEGVVKVVSDTIIRQLHAGNTYTMYNGQFTEGKTQQSWPKWTKNKSSFHNMKLKDVLAELERQYNIQITSKDTDLNRLFSGGFPHDNIENALTAIVKPMNLSYQWKSKNSVVIYAAKN